MSKKNVNLEFLEAEFYTTTSLDYKGQLQSSAILNRFWGS